MSIDTTIGGSNSNSYVSLEEASEYFQNRLHSKDWESLREKEQALITASNQLDWYITWKGVKTSDSQSMDWPRSGVVDEDFFPIEDNVIPKQIKQATFELALSSIKSDRTSDNPMAGLSQIKAGSLSVKAEQIGYISTAKEAIPEKIWKLLNGLTSRSNVSVVRLQRA